MGSIARRSLRTDAEALARARRDARVCELRAKGMELREIAEAVGLPDAAAARAAMQRALLATLQAPADELRGVELTLLNQVIAESWELKRNPQPLVDRAGQPVILVDEETGQARAVADQAVINALNLTILKASEARRKLMGLDAPSRSVTASAKLTVADAQQLAIDAGVPAEVVYGTVSELPADG